MRWNFGKSALLRGVIASACCLTGQLSHADSSLDAQLTAEQQQYQRSCTAATVGSFEEPAIATPLPESALPKCDAARLYYGFDRAPDPTAALQCAYDQRRRDGKAAPTLMRGPDILSMLYANGFGVKRNIDLAERFVCESQYDGLPAMQARLARLESMRTAAEPAPRFDICEFATSGAMASTCAGIQSQWNDVHRAKELAHTDADWSAQARAAFAPLQVAEANFAETRSSSEQYLNGTAQGMLYVEELDRLKDQVLINLRDFAAGTIPKAGAREAAQADLDMRTLLTGLEQFAWQGDSQHGEVTAASIAKTQQAWLAARDAWLAFGAVAYPQLTPDRIRCRLTRQRIHQLQALRRWANKSS